MSSEYILNVNGLHFNRCRWRYAGWIHSTLTPVTAEHCSTSILHTPCNCFVYSTNTLYPITYCLVYFTNEMKTETASTCTTDVWCVDVSPGRTRDLYISTCYNVCQSNEVIHLRGLGRALPSCDLHDHPSSYVNTTGYSSYRSQYNESFYKVL